MANIKPILYAEDDENDAFLMQRAFAKLELSNSLTIVTDGKLTIAYLAGEPPYASRELHPLPCLVFLDLSMPRKTGLEVLQWKQSNASVASIPTIVLTSSNQQSDLTRAKSFGAHGYLIKPGDPHELLRLVKGVVSYWLGSEAGKGTAPGAFVDVGLGGFGASKPV